MKLFKGDKVMLSVDKDQMEICLDAGWSKTKPEPEVEAEDTVNDELTDELDDELDDELTDELDKEEKDLLKDTEPVKIEKPSTGAKKIKIKPLKKNRR